MTTEVKTYKRCQEAEDRFNFQLTDERHMDVGPQLTLLRRYAACHSRIVEMGTDDGSTALAFLLGQPERLDCFDLWRQKEVKNIERWAVELGVEFEMHAGSDGDSRIVDCPVTEMLYLDTDHVPATLLTELERHSPNVSETILLHDTTACGDYAPNPADYDGPWIPPGLWIGAIGPFMRSKAGRDWRLQWVSLEGTGLTCLTRR